MTLAERAGESRFHAAFERSSASRPRMVKQVLEHRVLVNPYRLESGNGERPEHLDLARRCLELVPRPWEPTQASR